MDTTDTEGWRPRASLDTLKLRATLYQTIRAFFAEREVLEVDTPSLSHATTTDPNISSFSTVFQSGNGHAEKSLYLITSPEFHMKRLLAADSGCIYQLCHVFRQAELGSQHNPEFTLLEWYRVGMDYHQLMREVAELVSLLINRSLYEAQYITYKEAFQHSIGIDPLSAPLDQLQEISRQAGLATPEIEQDNRDFYLDFLMSHQVQPGLGKGRLCFVYEYPASQCALAQIAPHDHQVAERFELFLDGCELANGFHELADGMEQKRRFTLEQEKRRKRGAAPVVMDQFLLDALDKGLPECSGVALGLDRLIQLMLGQNKLNKVLAFPFNHA